MLVSLNLNGKEDCKHIALNNRGEFMMNTRTGVPSTLVFGIASGIRNNGVNDKFPTYTTGRVLPPIRVDDNKRTKVKVEIVHYSVTIVGDDERLIAVSDGRHTTYYFRCVGGYRDFRINEGTRSLEEAYEALVRNLFTSDKPFAYLFWGVASEFIANYFRNNEVSISTNRLRVDGEQGFSDLKFISYNKECMNIIYSLNGVEHSVDVFTHPLLQLKSDELFNKYSLEVDQLNTVISVEQIEEVRESLEERTEEEEVTEISLNEKLRRAFANRSREETLGGVIGVVEDISEEEEEDILVEASTMDLGGGCEEETPLTTSELVEDTEKLTRALETSESERQSEPQSEEEEGSGEFLKKMDQTLDEHLGETFKTEEALVEGVEIKPNEPCSGIVVDIVETEDKE